MNMCGYHILFFRRRLCLCAVIFFLALTAFVFTLPYLSSAQVSRGIHVVTIDPAHGGSDPGVKLSESSYEKEITLAISLLLKKEISKLGNIQVRLTRDSDSNVSMSERKRIAASSQSELFVSVHVNAGFGKASTGYEIYFPGFVTAVAEKGGSKEILRDMAKNKLLNDSVKLAQLIQKNMEGVFPRKSRGLRAAPVTVLDGLPMPAVAVEIAFATNPDDRKKIVDEKVQGAIARALAQSINGYF